MPPDRRKDGLDLNFKRRVQSGIHQGLLTYLAEGLTGRRPGGRHALRAHNQPSGPSTEISCSIGAKATLFRVRPTQGHQEPQLFDALAISLSCTAHHAIDHMVRMLDRACQNGSGTIWIAGNPLLTDCKPFATGKLSFTSDWNTECRLGDGPLDEGDHVDPLRSLPMPDQLTVKAGEALQDAERLAGSLNHSEGTSLHLLAALVQSDAGDNGGIIAPLLEKVGASVTQICSLVKSEMTRRPKVTGTALARSSA